jgi:hypothetical protein
MGCPRYLSASLSRRRDATSPPLPGGRGTMKVMGRLGNFETSVSWGYPESAKRRVSEKKRKKDVLKVCFI